MKMLVLASGSPSRKAILDRIGFRFIVDVSNYQEDMAIKLSPPELAVHLATAKAQEVASRHKNAVILGADSFAVYGGQLLGKPHTIKRAREMLRLLSGHPHHFITGFTIIDADTQKIFSKAVSTKVFFRKLSDENINDYLSKENVLDFAGAYIIQSLGSLLVDKIEGSYDNISGLPMAEVAMALQKFGISLL